MQLENIKISVLLKLIRDVSSITSLCREGRPPIENLVLEGGGIKGGAYTGALLVMAEKGMLDKIKRVGGSSAGGIISLLLAVGYNAIEIQDIMLNKIYFPSLLDAKVKWDPTRLIKFAGMKIGVTDLISLYQHHGFYSGEKFVELFKKYIGAKLEEKIRLLCGDLENKETKFKEILTKCHIDNLSLITFSQLAKLCDDFPELRLKKLYVTGTNLSDASLKIFSADTEPHMPIFQAIRITMSFPFGFEPVLFQGHLYADGGIADNYPIGIFDADEFLSHGVNESGTNPCTLGLKVDSDREIRKRWGRATPELEKSQQKKKAKKPPSLFFMAGKTVSGLHSRTVDRHSINTIQIFDEDVKTMEFDLSELKKKQLLESGRSAMSSYIENYIENEISFDKRPPYSSIYEQYFSRKPQEIIRILEEDFIPLLAELNALIYQLREINIEQELISLERKINLIQKYTLKQQFELFEHICALKKEKEKREQDLKEQKDNIQIQETETDNLFKTIQDLQNEQTTHLSTELIRIKENLVQRKAQLEDNCVQIERISQLLLSLTKLENKDIFALFEQQKKLKFINEVRLFDNLKTVEQIFHEHIDVMLEALSAKQVNYGDPRFGKNKDFEIKRLHDIHLQELILHYSKTELESERVQARAEKHNELIDDLIQFDLNVKTAKEHAAAFFLELSQKNNLHSANELEIRQKMFQTLLINELLAKKLITPQENTEEIKKQWDEKVQYFLKEKQAKQSDAEYLAKKQIIAEKEQSITPRKTDMEIIDQNPAFKSKIDHEYSVIIKETTDRFKKGTWSSCLLTNYEDLIHNAVDGDTRKSFHWVTTLDFEPRKKASLFSSDLICHPPHIRAYILRPDQEILKNPRRRKEIIVAFDGDKRISDKNLYSLLSRFSSCREEEFAYVKDEILHQILSIMEQCKAIIQPKHDKFQITIIGEGLGGQDAQYLLSEIAEKINENIYLKENIFLIKVLLIDPTKISNKIAEKALPKIIELRSFNIKMEGYNLIHQEDNKVVTCSKTSNYVGETNILSKIPSTAGMVMVDFRDISSRQMLKLLTNADAPLLQLLNIHFNFPILGMLGTQIGRLVSLTQYVTPQAFLSVGDLVTSTSKFMFKNIIVKPFNLVSRTISGKNEPPPSIPNWNAILNKKIFAKKLLIDIKSSQPTWDATARKFVELARASTRLREKRPNIENIAFEACGTNAIAYTGALKKMSELGLLGNLKRFIGSGTGGVIAALSAIGYSPDELIELLCKQLDFVPLKDKTTQFAMLDEITDFLGIGADLGLADLISLFKNAGIYKGDAFEELIVRLIKEKLEFAIKTLFLEKMTMMEILSLEDMAFKSENERNRFFDNFLNEKLERLKERYQIADLGRITFEQLKRIGIAFPELKIKECYITGTKIRNASLVIFSEKTEPEMPIFKALKITMSLPGAYIPVKHGGEYYMSGAISAEYPISFWDKEEYLTHGVTVNNTSASSIGFVIGNSEQVVANWHGNPSISLTLRGLIGQILCSLGNRSEKIKKYTQSTIKIDNVETKKKFDFNLSEQQKRKLVKNGEVAVEKHCEILRKTPEFFEHLNLEVKYANRRPDVELLRILDELNVLLNIFKEIEDEIGISLDQQKINLLSQKSALDRCSSESESVSTITHSLDKISIDSNVQHKEVLSTLPKSTSVSNKKTFKSGTTLDDAIKILQLKNDLELITACQEAHTFILKEKNLVLQRLGKTASVDVVVLNPLITMSKNKLSVSSFSILHSNDENDDDYEWDEDTFLAENQNLNLNSEQELDPFAYLDRDKSEFIDTHNQSPFPSPLRSHFLDEEFLRSEPFLFNLNNSISGERFPKQGVFSFRRNNSFSEERSFPFSNASQNSFGFHSFNADSSNTSTSSSHNQIMPFANNSNSGGANLLTSEELEMLLFQLDKEEEEEKKKQYRSPFK